ncbi:YdcF family protein [Salinisphaera hydrothermalis]|uniref:YdcF family protein n=1 Tax=Salinisphaera hydrothermalis TaxID=563188 RepID=UPI0018DD21F9|nr:YdcF family protein [Salinisphaera hydrothermalis]
MLTLAAVDIFRIGNIPASCAQHAEPQSVALVLSGAPHYRRTRHAVALYRAGRVAQIVFSGAGSGGDSAQLLARQAREMNIPPGHIHVEGRARSTYQNFEYSCVLTPIRTAPRVAIVTDRFHAYRAWATARQQCPTLHFCSAPVDNPVTLSRRFNEASKLLGYQLLGRATLW